MRYAGIPKEVIPNSIDPLVSFDRQILYLSTCQWREEGTNGETVCNCPHILPEGPKNIHLRQCSGCPHSDPKPKCECEAAGFCNRHGITKNVREHQLCQGVKCTTEQRDKYWHAWEERRYHGQPNAPQDDAGRSQSLLGRAVNGTSKKIEIGEGPGMELKRLLAKFQIFSAPDGSRCSCDEHAIQMNEWGADRCEKELDTIVGWLHAEAKKRKIPFFKPAARALVRRAIRNSRRHKTDKPTSKQEVARPSRYARTITWSVGVTTVQSRRYSTLPATLRSVNSAGFDPPHLFIDGPHDESYAELVGLGLCYELTFSGGGLGVVGNWYSALWHLVVRNPKADRYLIVQDDVELAKNCRPYLDKVKYPEGHYVNLYVSADNEAIVPPDHVGLIHSRLRQRDAQPRIHVRDKNNFEHVGRGALALMFDRKAAQTVLAAENMVGKPFAARNPRQTVDGAIVTAFEKKRRREFLHVPGLAQHLGMGSSVRPGHVWEGGKGTSSCYVGSQFDCTEWLK